MSVQEALKLGAFDLKRYANRNLALGFGISVLLLSLLLVIPMIGKIFEAAEEEDLVAVGPVTLEDFAEEDLKNEEPTPPDQMLPPPPPPPMAQMQDVGSGSQGAMGNIVATTDPVEGPDIADMSEMSFADSKGGGDGGAIAFDPNTDMPDATTLSEGEGKLNSKPAEEYPDFVPDATAPKWDIAELQRNIVYPTLARENGQQGIVHIKVSLDENGRVKKLEMQKGNEIFRKAAEDAIRKTTFTPAIQNGYPIPMSVTVKVEFKLED